MKKNVLLGISAFGGLILISSLLTNTPDEETNEPASTNSAATTLPSEVTGQFPVHPDTVVSNFRESTGSDGRISYSFSLTAETSIPKANDWYRTALSQNGWSIKSDKNVAGYQIIQAENGNLYTTMQAASGAEDTTTISQQAMVRAN